MSLPCSVHPRPSRRGPSPSGFLPPFPPPAPPRHLFAHLAPTCLPNLIFALFCSLNYHVLGAVPVFGFSKASFLCPSLSPSPGSLPFFLPVPICGPSFFRNQPSRPCFPDVQAHTCTWSQASEHPCVAQDAGRVYHCHLSSPAGTEARRDKDVVPMFTATPSPEPVRIREKGRGQLAGAEVKLV